MTDKKGKKEKKTSYLERKRGGNVTSKGRGGLEKEKEGKKPQYHQEGKGGSFI